MTALGRHMLLPKRALDRFRADQRGVAAIEFAILAPLLVTALLGLADVGIMVADQMRLNQITRETVAVAMFQDDTDTLAQILSDQVALSGGSLKGAAITSTLQAEFQCGGTTISSPYTLCPDGLAPQHVITINASFLQNNYLLPSLTMSSELSVEVR